MLCTMKDQDKYIELLRYMSSILRVRKSNFFLTDYQRDKCKEGIVALDKAVEALEVQIHA